MPEPRVSSARNRVAYTNTKNAMAMVFVTRHAGMTNPSAAKSGDWRYLRCATIVRM